LKDRFALGLYLGAVLLATSVHRLSVLAALLAAAILLAGPRCVAVGRRALLSVIFFTSIVTVSYVPIALAQGEFSAWYVGLLNLRVFLLAFLTFLLADRINLFRALAFSRTLLFLLTIAYGQIITFRRLFVEFRAALSSRTIERPSMLDVYLHGASTAGWFFRKALHESREITLAMKSRGFFHAEG